MYHQRLCWHKGGILGSGARQSLGEAPAATLEQPGPGFQAQSCHCRPWYSYFSILGLSFPLVN